MLFVMSSLLIAEDSDTLTQIAATEVSMRKLTPELEKSKKRMEQNSSSKTREQLYREVFGIPPPKPPRQVEASLTVNEKVDGKIDVVFSDDRTDFSIPAPPVISMIAEMISTELLNSVKSKINDGRLTKSQLDELRFETTFDVQDYLVHIEIPPDLLSKQVHDLKGYRDDPYVVECTKPNAISAYINVYANEKLKYLQSSSNDSSNMYSTLLKKSNKEIRQPVYGNIDGAININGVVLEGGGSYREMYDHPIQKKDVRLVYDLPRKFLRFTAGDLAYKTTGYLSYVTIGGIGIAKDYTLQPHVNSYPVSDREFFLNEQSEVDVWVNDVLVKSLVLDPGTHDIRGFPFASGSNKVRIVIKDFSGRSETLDFSYVYEPALLAKGKSQYTCNIGAPSTISRNGYEYTTNDPYLLASYKRGLTDRLTFDMYGQGFADRAIAGSEGIYAFSLGNLNLNLAGSYNKTDGPDYAARLGFFYRSKVSYSKKGNALSNQLQRINPITWNTEVEYIGPKFPKRIQDSLEYYDDGIRFSTALAIPMQGQFDFGLKSTYTIRPDSSKVFGIDIGFQKTLFRFLRTGANLSYTSDTKTKLANPAVSINAQWTFISGPHSFSVNETVSKQPPVSVDTLLSSATGNHKWGFNTDVQWDYLDLNPRPEKLTTGITARVGEEYSEYNGRLGYNGNCGSIEFNQNLATPGYFQEQFIQHQSDLTLKTALVFAGGTIALSRPVYGGFMIAKGVKNLKRSKIRVNPNDEGYDATSVWYSPAVLTLNSPYLLQKINLSPLNSSVASVNEKMSFNLYPHYKSGFLLTVGTDITVLVIGTLLDTKGKPFKYQSITIKCKDDPGFVTVNTFTNQGGKFQFMGTAGQTYEMRLSGTDSTGKPIPISIPKDKNDYYRVGEVYADGNQQQVSEDVNDRIIPDSSMTKTIVDSSNHGNDMFATDPEPQSNPADSADSNETVTWAPSKEETESDTVKVDPEDMVDESLAKNLVDRRARQAYVMGTLKGPQGVLPFTAFEVTQVDDPLQNPIRSFTNQDGKFQIICAKPTNYRILAPLISNGDTVPGTTTFYVTARSMGSHCQVGKLTLIPDQNVSLTVLPSNDASILVTGIIIDNNGQPMQYTPFSFISLNETRSSFTDKDGSFEIICPASGRYMISIKGSKNGPGTLLIIPPGTKGRFDIGRQTMVPNEPPSGQLK